MNWLGAVCPVSRKVHEKEWWGQSKLKNWSYFDRTVPGGSVDRLLMVLNGRLKEYNVFAFYFLI